MQTHKFNKKCELYNKIPWKSADYLRNLQRFLFLVSVKQRKPNKHLGQYQYLDTSMIRFPSIVFRALYRYLDKWDKDQQLIFMNYGYSDPGVSIQLDETDEKDRYTVQLYHHMADMTDLKNKDIVEVGSGRGGGLAYIARKFMPKSAVGIDLEKSIVVFSNKYHQRPNLTFITGDAQELPIEDNSCDVLLNVESSHRYKSIMAFFNEVHRVLRPGGYFLFTDFRDSYKWPDLLKILNESGFKVIEERDISSNILRSLELDSERREALVQRYAPKLLQKAILNFTGSKGTDTYDNFLTGKYIYKSFMIQKNGDLRHISHS